MPWRRALVVNTGRHPFEVAFFIAAIAVGVILIASGTSPASASSAMPVVVQGLWKAGLIIGGLTGLSAAWSQKANIWRGLGIELFTMAILGSALAMYAVALFAVSGMAALAAGGFVTAFGAACWWRFGQILNDLRKINRAAREKRVEPVPLLTEEVGRE
jgi:hypothetical protein